MCTISESLKLCSCKTKNVEQLQNYWILYKFCKCGIEILGEAMPPQEFKIGKESNQYNIKRLEEMLNDGNCFDVELQIDDKDILELVFSCDVANEKIYLVYEYVFRKDRWIANEYDPFNSDKVVKYNGKIGNAF